MRKNFLKLAVIGWAFALTACVPMTMIGGGKLEDAAMAVYPIRTDVSDLSSGLEAFRTVVAPLISDSQCTACHTTQAPTLGSSVIEIAYEAAISRLNKTNPASSAIISKSQDGHCGGCSTASRSDWTSAIETWARVEVALGGSGGGPGPAGPGAQPANPPVDLGTPPVFMTPVQQMNGTGGNNRLISLAGRGGAFGGVSLMINLQDPYAAVANTARIFTVRLQNNSGSYILVRGIRIFQSQDANVDPTNPQDFLPDVGAAFSDVDAVIYPNATTQLSFGEALMSKSDGLFYAFGFQALEVTNAPTCKAQAVFNNTVNPILNACTGCHNAGGSGSGRWTLAADATNRCLQSLQRSDLNTPIASRLIQAPRFRVPNHPNQALNDAQVDTIINWITLEQ